VCLSLAAGCTRTYAAVEPRVVQHERLSVVPHELVLPLALAPRMITVDLRTNGLPRTSLRAARLAPAVSQPCSSGADFVGVEEDGIEQTEGPVDLEGAHALSLSFVDESTGILRHPMAVDLELGDTKPSSCARVPLIAGRDAPQWRMRESSAGFLLSAGGRGYPLLTTSSVGIEPIAAFVMRMGAGFGDYRAWGEVAAAGGRSTGYTNLDLAAGADRVIWQEGPLAFLFGAGYDFVFTFYRAPDAQKAESGAFLHGPRLTPSLSFTFLQNIGIPSLSAGRRTFYLELATPISLWFGTKGAPASTLVPGVGLDLVWVL